MRKYSIMGALGIAFIAAVATAASTTLVPVSDGAYTTWTPSSGSSHFTLVDESSCNGTTDYVSTNTVGNRDSFGVSLNIIPTGAVITQISISPCASKNGVGGGNSGMKVFHRLNGADSADSASYSLTGITPAPLSATTYSGLSVVKNASTTLEIGAVLTSGTKGARLSRLATTVTYTPIPAPSNLSATAFSSSQIDLAWTDNSIAENAFLIERRNATASTTFATIATTTANVVSYNDINVVGATTYEYRVRASGAAGVSSYSNTASATTP